MHFWLEGQQIYLLLSWQIRYERLLLFYYVSEWRFWRIHILSTFLDGSFRNWRLSLYYCITFLRWEPSKVMSVLNLFCRLMWELACPVSICTDLPRVLLPMDVLAGLELRMTTSTRLKACLYSFTSPGGPMYPTRAVRHAAWGALDLLFPVRIYFFFFYDVLSRCCWLIR